MGKSGNASGEDGMARSPSRGGAQGKHPEGCGCVQAVMDSRGPRDRDFSIRGGEKTVKPHGVFRDGQGPRDRKVDAFEKKAVAVRHEKDKQCGSRAWYLARSR
jgi:hypothetical protein